MQILNKENLDAAIKKCQDLARYRVYLVTEHAKSHKEILDYLDGKITLDEVINTMYETGKDLSVNYRETAMGGLAKLKKE